MSKKGVYIILAVFFIGITAIYGVANTTWGDFLEDGTKESFRTNVYTPSRLAFDENLETYWSLDENETTGFIERYFNEEKDFESIELYMRLPEEVTMTIYWENDESLIPYETAFIKGPVEDYKYILLPDKIRKTKHVLFSIEGFSATECKIYEIKLKERSNCTRYGKIIPESYFFNQEEYINIKPERLWSGNIYETWYEPLWYIPWEIMQGPEGERENKIFAPFTGHPSNPAEIIWNLDTTYNIEYLKVYFTAEYRNICFEFWDGETWNHSVNFEGNTSQGWIKQKPDSEIYTDKIRITFPYGWEMARNINQIEVWGEGIPSNFEKKVLFSYDKNLLIYKGTIDDGQKEDIELEVITECGDDNKVTLDINQNKKITDNPKFINENICIYKFDIKKDLLNEYFQYFEINTYGKNLKAVIRNKLNKNGEIALGGYLSDDYWGRLSSNEAECFLEKRINLQKKYQLEKIKIFTKEGSSVRIAKDETYGDYYECKYNEEGYWETDLESIIKDKIAIFSDTEMEISEIDLFGSPLEEDNIPVEIWKVAGAVNNSSIILGWIGNSETKVCLDNINMRQADNLYWIPIKECGKDFLESNEHIVTAVLDSKKSERKYFVEEYNEKDIYKEKIKNSGLCLWVDFPYGDILTQKDLVTVSGCVGNGCDIQVFINGEEAVVSNDHYKLDVQLAEGKQSIVVRAEDKTNRSIEKIFYIIRDSVLPEIEIIHPEMDEYINTGIAAFRIDGKEEDLWWKFNEEAWESGFGQYKYKEYELKDGYYTYTVKAEDRAGNISLEKQVSFCMDATAPKEFNISVNVRGWTNNNTPIAEFETTDDTSGINYYEYRVDDGDWDICESPLKLDKLEDGRRLLQVRAVDKAQNFREEEIEIFVDTSCPPQAENIRPVPDENSIFLKWTGIDDNSISDNKLIKQEGFRSYYIERKPEWKEGVKLLKDYGYGKLVYEDTDVEQQKEYSYRICSIDRAGNKSSYSDWKSGIAGLAVSEIDRAENSIIEFEGITITIPEYTTAEDIIRIQINEVPLTALTEIDSPENPLISGIYSVTAVRIQDGNEVVTNHADLLEKATLEIGYSELLIPEDYDESQLAVFYYDDLWGCWLQMRDSYIDTEANLIRCQTSHFTEFSVQATKKTVFSEEELRKDSYSLNSGNIGPGEIYISEEDTSVSHRFVELQLPGKNDLDLSLQRVYSLSKAYEDSYGQGSAGIDGESVWKIADGWRINMPYMKWNGSCMFLYGMDGMVTSLGQMILKSEAEEGSKKTIIMESNEYIRHVTELRFNKTVRKYFFGLFSSTSYSFEQAILHQNDGKVIYFDSKGRVTKITDLSDTNKITLTYNDNLIEITDSYGRNIALQKTNGLIDKITYNNKTVNYTIKKEEFNNTGNGWNFQNKNIYALKRAEDIGGRIWSYDYNFEVLKSKIVESSKISDSSEKDDYNKRHVAALSEVSGSGIGYTKIEYGIDKDISYQDSIESCGQKYFYTVLQDKISVKNKKVWIDETSYKDEKECLRTNSYNVRFSSSDIGKTIYASYFSVYDGRQTIVKLYKTVQKTRNRLSSAPEAIRAVSGYNVSIADAKGEPEILTYLSNIKVYDGLINIRNLIQEERTNTFDETFMKVRNKETIKGGKESNKIKDIYDYDGNGNIIFESHEYNTAGVINGINIIRKNIYKENLFLYFPEIEIKDSYGYGLDGKKVSVLEYKKYEYNDLGQIIKSYIIDKLNEDTETELKNEVNSVFETIKSNSENKTSEYISSLLSSESINNIIDGNTPAYCYTYESFGRVKTINSQENNCTEYIYAEEENKQYSTTVRYNNIYGVNTSLVEEKKVYDWNYGNLIRYDNKSGYVSKMEYDVLGRITNQKKYHEKNINGVITNNQDYSEIKVSYDDKNFTTEVIDELGCLTLNTFDNLGRLLSVKKTGQTIDRQKESITANINIQLEYDMYDRVIKKTEPFYGDSSSTSKIYTTYLYDSQNRLLRVQNADNDIVDYEYDDSINQITQINKKLIDNNNVVAENIIEKKIIQFNLAGKTIKEISIFQSDGENTVSEKIIQHYYDGNGNEIISIDAKGNITKKNYNAYGLIKNIEYPNSLKEFNYYDKDGHLIKTVKKDGDILLSENNYKSNALGYIYSITASVSENINDNTVVTDRIYDGEGNILSESNYYKEKTEDKRELNKAYDWNGKLIKETDGENHSTYYEYDNKGNLLKVTDPRQENSNYNADFFMTMEYDSFGRLIKGQLPHYIRQNNENENNYDVILVYDAQGNVIYREDPENVKTSYTYSKMGNLLSEDKSGYKTQYVYNGAGKLIRQINPDNTWIYYDYDLSGNLIKEYVSGNNNAIIYTYDNNKNIKTKTDRNGNKTNYTYDSMNHIIKENTADLIIKAYNFDKLGRCIQEEDGEKNIRQYSYDFLGRIISERVNKIPETILLYEYDARGNITRYKDANGAVFIRKYTKADKLLEENVYLSEIEENPVTSRKYKYDEGNELISIEEGNNKVIYNNSGDVDDSSYQPDAYGNLRSEYNSITGWTMSYDYDELNRLISVKTPDNKVQNYSYNENNQILKMDGYIRDSAKYINSRLAAYTLEKLNFTKLYEYNDSGLISKLLYEITDDNNEKISGFSYEYDENFNIKKRTRLDTEKSDIYEYDAANRLNEASLTGKYKSNKWENLNITSLSFVERDIEGLLTTPDIINVDIFSQEVLLDSKGKSFIYDFGKKTDILKIELYKTNSDIQSRVREKDIHIYYKSDKEDIWKEADKESWNYREDKSNQSLHFTFKNIINCRFIKIRTIWDDRNEDNISLDDYATFKNSSVKNMLRIWTFKDSRNEKYAYDNNSNRLSYLINNEERTYIYYKNKEDGNTALVKFDGEWYYAYDRNGNRTKKGRALVQETEVGIVIDETKEFWTYTWDCYNRLINVRQYNEPDNGKCVNISYEYDALNHRLKRYDNEENTITKYAYGRSGALIYQEETRQDNSVFARSYKYLNNEIVGWIDREGLEEKEYYTVNDHEGSVTEVYDNEGCLVWKNEYTAFGINAGESINLIDFNGMYTGCDFDVATGLTYHWNRWRNENGNAFISEDPARYGYNWYGYAGQNPVMYTDPSGLNDKKAYEEIKNNLYMLKIKINLPGKDSTRDTLSSSKVEKNTNGKLSVDGGHVFVTLIHVNLKTLEAESNSYGLYPAEKSGIIKGKTVKGIIKDDSKSYYDNSFTYFISKEEYESVFNYAREKKENPPQYNLYKNNCVDFSIRLAKKANINLPNLPVGSSPSNLNKILKINNVIGGNE